jgi:hypothetical protein
MPEGIICNATKAFGNTDGFGIIISLTQIISPKSRQKPKNKKR